MTKRTYDFEGVLDIERRDTIHHIGTLISRIQSGQRKDDKLGYLNRRKFQWNNMKITYMDEMINISGDMEGSRRHKYKYSGDNLESVEIQHYNNNKLDKVNIYTLSYYENGLIRYEFEEEKIINPPSSKDKGKTFFTMNEDNMITEVIKHDAANNMEIHKYFYSRGKSNRFKLEQEEEYLYGIGNLVVPSLF